MKFLFAALMAGWMVLVANANAARADEQVSTVQCDDADVDATVKTQNDQGTQATAPANKPAGAKSLNDKK